MVPRIFELRPIESQPYQPHPESEQLVITLGLPHDRTALGDGFGGHGKAQVDIGCGLSGVKCGVETAPFHGSPIKDGVQIQGMISGPIIVL